MDRRSLLKGLPIGLGAAAMAAQDTTRGPLPRMKITRVRYYHTKTSRPVFNQSSHIVTVETDQGITGIGEGGTRDPIEQLAGLIIGEDPSRIEHLWQLMYRHYFYPPGREKVHAQGAIDLALWDIKGKALGVPVYQLLGGLARDYVECYSTGFPNQGTLRDTARACIEFGFRAFRFHGANPDPGQGWIARQMVDRTVKQCEEIFAGVGEHGEWAIDFHTRYDYADAVRLCSLIEHLRPLFVEDPVRSENKDVYRELRRMVKVPLAVGEHYGDKWDSNWMVENRLYDYSRVTLPNSGGITDFMKLAAICETHYVGLVPHFTGPVATAALVHCLSAASGPVCMEMLGRGEWNHPHLPYIADFRAGKLYPTERPGLGVEFDPNGAELVSEITEQYRPTPLYNRPDGSITNW